MGTHKIEKGLPIPSWKNGKWTSTLRKMDLGDSFKFKMSDYFNLASALQRFYHTKNNSDKKFSMRKLYKECRCWRIN